MDKITKKVALYVRVSSEKQEKEKTIQSQLDVLREICKEKGLDIIKEYSDNGGNCKKHCSDKQIL